MLVLHNMANLVEGCYSLIKPYQLLNGGEMMKVLIVGGGGREHAIAWGISRTGGVKIFCAPGNGGTAVEFNNVNIAATDTKALADFAEKERVNLTIAGPEAPLVAGLADEFHSRNLPIIGPPRAGALLEGSKVFAKELMKEAKIPTAEFHVFSNPEDAASFIKKSNRAWVVKADGLAAGKGVIVPESVEEALHAVDRIMVKKEFGEAGARIVVEERLEGYECSAIALFDGRDFLFFDLSQDHKRVFDGDKGPNTGGMGAYSPVPFISSETVEKIKTKVFSRLAEALHKRGIEYRGVIYAGLMMVDGEPYVLEFNVRFGDPEAQPLIMRLDTPLLELLQATWNKELGKTSVSFSTEAAVCVVMASAGYPGAYEKGKQIEGLDEVEKMEKVKVFHAGTTFKEGYFYTSGGRVLGVTALGSNVATAADKAYTAVKKIRWDGLHYRRDIAYQAIHKTG